MQAFPWQFCDLTAEVHTLRSLAGSVWTGTVYMAVFFSMAVHLPWAHGANHEVDDDEPDDLDIGADVKS